MAPHSIIYIWGQRQLERWDDSRAQIIYCFGYFFFEEGSETMLATSLMRGANKYTQYVSFIIDNLRTL